MLELWFLLAAIMLAAWSVLDGFSLGSGVLSAWVAKNDHEKRTVLAAIGPYWDGNEVCLIASGGVLLLAFPKTMTAGFSGFYLPLFFILWLLIGRGLSIELRSHLPSELWRSFWDFIFSLCSLLLLFLFGVALGNILRGVPLNQDGYFSLPLFGDFTTTGTLGVLDWYTILIGVFVVVTLTGHGALFLRWKTQGIVNERARALAPELWIAVVVLWALTFMATAWVTPLVGVFFERLWLWPALLLFLGGLAMIFFSLRRQKELLGFIGSSFVIVGLLLLASISSFPIMLRSTTNEVFTLTAYNNETHQSGLQTALFWWIPAFIIACGYFLYVFKTFRGKAEAAKDGEGY
jgi:cytochrome d ubiquinol oxidase subunit II